jgi:hypothetical protein
MMIAIPSVAAVARTKLIMFDAAQMADARFIVEQLATLTTALTAAIAAFRSTIPGFDRRILLLPLAPLAVWLVSVGQGCVQDWIRLGAAGGLAIRPDWDCLPMASIIGILPAVAIVAMLRRGLSLHPRVTLALAALAVASVANLGLQFAHAQDVSIMVLIWHLGAAAILSGVGGLLGEVVLRSRA